jgi:hypothetical protein
VRQPLRLSIGLVVIVGLSGCAASSSATPAGPKTFDATGSVSVPTGADSRYVGEPCDQFRGVDDRKLQGNYDDVKAGGQVVVKDSAGKTVALGKLDAGKLVQVGATKNVACRYPFKVTGIPGGKFFAIHVGNSSRDDASFTEAQLKAGADVSIDLG